MEHGDHGVGTASRRWHDPVPAIAALVLVLLLLAGTAAARAHGAVRHDPGAAVRVDVATAAAAGVATASVSAVRPAEAPPESSAAAGFTLGDLAAGRVPQEVQDRFWQAQLDAIVAAPCPGAATAGSTTVTLHVGADEAWTARLADAAGAHRAACGA